MKVSRSYLWKKFVLIWLWCILLNLQGKTMAEENYIDLTINHLKTLHATLEKITLKNGISCLFKRDISAPVVSIQLWFGTGSIHEEEYLGSGLSHAVEHMIFKGTEKRKVGDITREIDNAGGSVNAYTSFDRTVFHADMPSRTWVTGLEVLSDAVFNSSFPAEEWDKEKNVILREIAMNNDDPDSVLSKMLWQTAYKVHPYRFPIIGHEELFKRIERNDLLKFCRRNYLTDNMFVVIVGDVEKKEVEAALEKNLGNIERRTRTPVILPKEPEQLSARITRQTGKYELGRMELAFHTVPLNHSDAPTLEILAQIVGAGDSSRLNLLLRDKLRLVHAVSAWSYTPREAGLFGISAVFDPDKEKKVLQVLKEEILSWQKVKFPDNEIQKAKRMLIVQEMNGFQTMKGQADKFAAGEFYASDPSFTETWIKQLAKVTAEDLNNAAKKYLNPETASLAILMPETTVQAATNINTAVEKKVPTKVELDNKVPLIILEDNKLPFVSLCVVFKGGVLIENSTNSGITQLASELLLRGTPKFTAEEIARETESRGASLEPFCGWNSFGLKGRCLAQDARFLMSMMAECLINSVFPENEVEQYKSLQIAEIKQKEEDPVFIAQKSLGPLIFGDHPYGRDLLGTTGSVSTIKRSDIIDHYKKLAVAENMAIACFGSIEKSTVLFFCNKIFGEIPSGKPFDLSTCVPQTPHLPGREERIFPKEQAVVLLGYKGISITDPRFEVSRVLQDSLSGLSSDLAEEVREKRGLAYYVGAYQRTGIQPGAFVFYAGTHPQAVQELEVIMRKEAKRLTEQGIRQEELERAKNRLLAIYEMSLQNNTEVAMNCALNELYGLGFDHLYATPDRIKAVTAESVKNLAADLFKEELSAVSIVSPTLPSTQDKNK